MTKKTIIGLVLFLCLILADQAFARWGQAETSYWGASGTAHCHNNNNVSVWVGMSYTQQNDALTELWNKAVAACQHRGGLFDVSGSVYSQWGPYW
ncbi:MAG: hypothetical protein Q3M24_02330 [Candidatus Electrothrix aestuarii]|uniref:Uncharacterized protein n=1 Tax=Candidatus Electrothrix aestuarii TaxID=3062594 RepID=A0AAU8LWF0_9BACT|nr:hypothetical protein [Candidatus Electrothrix aestuarii]